MNTTFSLNLNPQLKNPSRSKNLFHGISQSDEQRTSEDLYVQLAMTDGLKDLKGLFQAADPMSLDYIPRNSR